MKPTWEEQIDTLIHDITSVGFMPKSEAMRRLTDLLTQAEHIGARKMWEEIKLEKKLDYIADSLHGYNQAIEDITTKANKYLKGEE